MEDFRVHSRVELSLRILMDGALMAGFMLTLGADLIPQQLSYSDYKYCQFLKKLI